MSKILSSVTRVAAAGKRAVVQAAVNWWNSPPKHSTGKRALLSTYVASLMSLMLCVTMFLSTSYAWFTARVDVHQNQMFVGTLGVKLYHASFSKGELDADKELREVTPNHKVLTQDTKWEPGYTAVEKFMVEENGDLAFSYKLTIERDFTKDKDETQKKLAKSITVWTYTGADAASVVSFEGTTFAEMEDKGQWQYVGTLLDVMESHIPVFTGRMNSEMVSGNAANAAQYHMIALHMEENTDLKALGGPWADTKDAPKLDNITISLVANQMASGNDAFGNAYDPTPVDLYMAKNVPVGPENKTNAPVVFQIPNEGGKVSKVEIAVPEGTLTDGSTQFGLSIQEVDAEGEAADTKKRLALDISISGVAEKNTTVIPVTMTIEKGLENVEVYHGEKAMDKADSGKADTYSYDPQSGELKLYVTNFSTFTIVSGVDGVSTYEELVKALETSESIKLVGDLNLADKTVKIPENKEVTLYLGGYDITAAKAAFMIPAGSTLNVKGQGNVELTGEGTIFQNDGTMNIHGGSYDAEGMVMDNRGTANIYGGTFALSGDGENIIRNGAEGEAQAVLNVHGGIFKANGKAAYIWNDVSGEEVKDEMNFLGGTFDSSVYFRDSGENVKVAKGVAISQKGN